MDNHVHLLLETPTPNLGARACSALHGDYAQSFNRRHGLNGHVFQGRYDAVRVRVRQADVDRDGAYIAGNPVEAGALRTAGRVALEQPRARRCTRRPGRRGSTPRGCSSDFARSAAPMTPVRRTRRGRVRAAAAPASR